MSYRVESRKRGWSVILDTVIGGKRRQVALSMQEALDKGFYPNLTLEEAISLAKKLSFDSERQRFDALRTKTRLELIQTHKELHSQLPEPFVTEFETVVLPSKFEDSIRARHQWRAAMRIICMLEVPMEDWSDYPSLFYQIFKKNHFSADYSRRLLRLINTWGAFLAKKTRKAYLPIPFARGAKRQAITDSSTSQKSAPVTPDMLHDAKNQLIEGQYKWLFVAVWFGLRPHEVDSIANTLHWKITTEIVEDQPRQILHIYQSKLISVKKELRWKLIPALFPGQVQALAYINEGQLERPLNKTIKRYVNPKSTCYGPRKGFVTLMRSFGRGIYETSNWLGHTSIDRTRQDYEERAKLIVEKKR